ncbi:hypothetical protein K9U40_12625 [Xanthobacter autotrophicus]|uniref:hypothetical protein n=1 Tax=Xanthobacter TaxID=279 RepID=UPI0024AC0710|nr:hypothetical protein [Xanthobacter autotrophicus]MDI4665167.1 hypothetical protein [Xanthobacter autotrophicus]
MGRSLPPTDPASLRIVIGDAEIQASSVDDVVRFLRQQEADDFADLLLALPADGPAPSLGDVCARMEALCAMV